jgi:hypothetical protein
LSEIAKSTDGGVTWTDKVQATLHTGAFTSIAFESGTNPSYGLAVGESKQSPYDSSEPLILYTNDGGENWIEPTISGLGKGSLNRVVYSGSDHFWACGDNGLVIEATHTGSTWSWALVGPPETNFEGRGMAMALPERGVLVGRTSAGAPAAYSLVMSNGSPTWSPRSLPSTVDILRDAVALGGYIYAVGRKTSGTTHSGVVLIYQNNAFAEVTTGSNFPSFTPWDTGFAPSTLYNSILNSIAIAPTTFDVWVGGDGGRVWQYERNTNAWILHKSQSSSHVTSMSFPQSDVGFVSLFRSLFPQQCVVRYKPGGWNQ